MGHGVIDHSLQVFFDLRMVERQLLSSAQRLVQFVDYLDDLCFGLLPEFSHMIEQPLAVIKVATHIVLRVDHIVSESLELEVPACILLLLFFFLLFEAACCVLVDHLA